MLRQALIDCRASNLALFNGLSSAQWQVPYLREINPPLWEFGHIAWFQEFWCLRRAWSDPGPQTAASVLAGADERFDSAIIAHADRWGFAAPTLAQLEHFMQTTLRRTLEQLDQTPEADDALYFFRLALFHELMHTEAFLMNWQTLGYQVPLPWIDKRQRAIATPQSSAQYLQIPAGQVLLGSTPSDGFVFDNEKWATSVDVESFAIGSRPVSNAQFQQFVTDGGYLQSTFWDEAAFASLRSQDQRMPRYWRSSATTPGTFEFRLFGDWVPLDPDASACHISANEAAAYCRWSGTSLPSEAQWQRAAVFDPRFEWGKQVWEWTSSTFGPLPGFSPDPYKEYSAPWFGDHRVVKGASWVTNAALKDLRFRNFYQPHRADPYIGFRVCKTSGG